MEASMKVAAQSRRIGGQRSTFSPVIADQILPNMARCQYQYQYSTGKGLYTFSWLCCLLFVYINLQEVIYFPSSSKSDFLSSQAPVRPLQAAN
jgi:hypothetical protein